MPPSMGRIAPVMNAGDEPRLVAAERHGRLGDLFGLADLAHRHGSGCGGLRLRTSTSQVVGEDRSGRPGLDARVVVGVVQRGGLGQADDAVFGPHVPGWLPEGPGRGCLRRHGRGHHRAPTCRGGLLRRGIGVVGCDRVTARQTGRAPPRTCLATSQTLSSKQHRRSEPRRSAGPKITTRSSGKAAGCTCTSAPAATTAAIPSSDARQPA